MPNSDAHQKSDIKGVVALTFATLLGLSAVAAFIAAVLSVAFGVDLIPEENRTKALIGGFAGSVFWLGASFAYLKQRQAQRLDASETDDDR